MSAKHDDFIINNKKGILMKTTKEETEELKDAIGYLQHISNLGSDTRYCVDVLIKQIAKLREALAKVEGGEG